MPDINNTDRDAAEIQVREALIGRIEEAPGVVNVQGRERRPNEGEDVEEGTPGEVVVTVPDPLTNEPIIRCVFVDWSRTTDRFDVADDTTTTLIISYHIRVVDQFVDLRKDGTNSKDEHKQRVHAIQKVLKASRSFGFLSEKVYHTGVKMPGETQIIEDVDGDAHLSLLTLDVEITGFKG